jgi:molecular chaperone DnaK (HSP70)
VSLTRTGFEHAIQPLVDSVAESVRTSIADADATVPDAVVLTGGSSQIPLVQQLVRAAAGNIAVHTTRYGAARGAALLGMPLAGHPKSHDATAPVGERTPV